MHSCILNVPFPSSKEAEIAFRTLSVDPEPRKDVIKKLSVDNTILNVQFSAAEARLLRVAIGSFFDLLILVVETIKEFGPPMESHMEQ